MRALLTLSLATLLGSLSGCCDCPNDAGPPPPIGVQGSGGGGSSGGEEPPPPETQTPSSGVDEGAAVNIALELAEQEGYDPAAYDDVVVEDAGANWVVQLRRPMANTFLEVRVDKRSGAADLRTASMN